MTAPNELFKAALNLTPKEKVELIDKMLSSLDAPDKELDKLWSQEAEDRITAFEKGEIKALTIKEVLEKYWNNRRQ
jgi:putative addiction module component (TIGR02574 family)